MYIFQGFPRPNHILRTSFNELVPLLHRPRRMCMPVYVRDTFVVFLGAPEPGALARDIRERPDCLGEECLSGSTVCRTTLWIKKVDFPRWLFPPEYAFVFGPQRFGNRVCHVREAPSMRPHTLSDPPTRCLQALGTSATPTHPPPLLPSPPPPKCNVEPPLASARSWL